MKNAAKLREQKTIDEIVEYEIQEMKVMTNGRPIIVSTKYRNGEAASREIFITEQLQKIEEF